MSAVVYFSSVSQNTHRFVQRLDPTSLRIPLRRGEGTIELDRPYVLVTPTYGSGDPQTSVPRQVARFLNDPANRSLIRGVVSSGNTNFGSAFCLAGRVIAARCNVPLLHRFELLGTTEDAVVVRQKLTNLWAELDQAVAA